MSACEHLVQFYESEDELVDSVVPYLAAGVAAGESLLVIATDAHRRAFAGELAAMGIGLEQALAEGTYVALDAAEMLARIRPDGELSEPEFDSLIGSLVRAGLSRGTSLRAYGEMVELLWNDGDAAGAIALEGMWNRLCGAEPMALFCAYRSPCSPEQLDPLRHVCLAHSGVVPSVTASDGRPVAVPLSAEFTPTIEAPGRARALLRSVLRELHFDEDLIDRSVLATSELVANAVLHARTPFRLLVAPKASSLWIGVEDALPLSDRHAVLGRSPHGLGLIAALALRWGITPRDAGKLIWAELPW